MTRVTYVPTLLRLATQLCKYIAIATPLIKTLFPANATLQAALVAAQTACSELSSELAAVREIGDQAYIIYIYI